MKAALSRYFICTFDYFNKGLSRYTFENECLEMTGLMLQDESTKIFLCANDRNDDVSEELKDFLNLLAGKETKGNLARKIKEKVENAREHEEWRIDYMTLLMRDKEMREEGRQEGRQESRQEIAKSLLRLNISIDVIIQSTGLTREEIEELQ